MITPKKLEKIRSCVERELRHCINNIFEELETILFEEDKDHELNSMPPDCSEASSLQDSPETMPLTSEVAEDENAAQMHEAEKPRLLEYGKKGRRRKSAFVKRANEILGYIYDKPGITLSELHALAGGSLRTLSNILNILNREHYVTHKNDIRGRWYVDNSK